MGKIDTIHKRSGMNSQSKLKSSQKQREGETQSVEVVRRKQNNSPFCCCCAAVDKKHKRVVDEAGTRGKSFTNHLRPRLELALSWAP